MKLEIKYRSRTTYHDGDKLPVIVDIRTWDNVSFPSSFILLDDEPYVISNFHHTVNSVCAGKPSPKPNITKKFSLPREAKNFVADVLRKVQGLLESWDRSFPVLPPDETWVYDSTRQELIKSPDPDPSDEEE